MFSTPLPDHMAAKPLDLEGVAMRLSMSPARDEIGWDGQPVGRLLPARSFVVHRGGLRREFKLLQASITMHGRTVVAETTGGWNRLCDEVVRLVEEHFRRHVAPVDWPPLILLATGEEAAQIRSGQRDTLYYPWADRYGIVTSWNHRPAEIRVPGGETIHRSIAATACFTKKQMDATSPRTVRRYPKEKAFAGVALDPEWFAPTGVAGRTSSQPAG